MSALPELMVQVSATVQGFYVCSTVTGSIHALLKQKSRSALLLLTEIRPPYSGNLAVYRSVHGDGLHVLCGLSNRLNLCSRTSPD